jgi:hypothetical protein
MYAQPGKDCTMCYSKCRSIHVFCQGKSVEVRFPCSVVRIVVICQIYCPHRTIYGAAHELRNELVEELSIDFISKGRAELDVEDVRESKTSKMESKKKQKR